MTLPVGRSITQVDCITDRNGSLIFNEIRGEVNMRTKLSGMPDCQLTFVNPRLLDDVSFHPCVATVTSPLCLT